MPTCSTATADSPAPSSGDFLDVPRHGNYPVAPSEFLDVPRHQNYPVAPSDFLDAPRQKIPRASDGSGAALPPQGRGARIRDMHVTNSSQTARHS